jgi:NAD(P)H-hydrate epimerase
MIPVLTSAEMRAADREAIDSLGIPGMALMESAGGAVARVIEARFPDAARLAILCGPGNNGGDGYVVARRLLGRRAVVVALASRRREESDASRHRAIFERSGGRVDEIGSPGDWQRVRGAVLEADLVVDALFGTGLQGAPRGLAATVITDLARRRQCPVVAIDVPSGIASDSTKVGGVAVRASLTVTFAALKPALVFEPAAACAGEVVVADIGLPAPLLSGGRLFVTERTDAAAAWPKRAATSHKGVQGHVLVIAGSPGKSGAAVLSATAALRAGCGLATVATSASALAGVSRKRPELMAAPLTIGPSGVRRALALAARARAVVLGPGLGQGPAVRAFVRRFVASCPVPLVIDAGGLNALVGATAPIRRRRLPTVLTPHPGEMARLQGTSTRAVQAARLQSVRALAAETGAVVVLKGHQTLTAEPSGRAAVNPTGNPGLAVAGAGDVLTGIVAALLARGRDAWSAATAAVFVHGLAADRIAASRGEEGILAGDLAEALPLAIDLLAPVRRP